MNLVTRAMRLARAMLTLRGLDRRIEQAGADPQKIVRESFGFCKGYLQPIQVEEEISQLVADVMRLQPRTVLEIGTSMGGTLYLWTRIAAPDATIVSIDLPHGKFGGGYSPLRSPLYRRFARPSQTLHLLRCDSHASDTFERVRGLLDNRPIDFLFID